MPDIVPHHPNRTAKPVRTLTAEDLGLTGTEEELEAAAEAAAPPEMADIQDNDTILKRVRELLFEDGYAGVIFSGPPGTGKSWYAYHIARRIVDVRVHPERMRPIQFHSSYQYEDFVEGFVPKAEGGFRLVKKHLLNMCRIAEAAHGEPCILIIDELSRSDPGRVFGEALTYIEMNKRGRKFRLASGREVSIPRNLFILATMNPVDRGADEIDIAFERRFAKISMEPSKAALQHILDKNGMDPALRDRLLGFFDFVQKQDREARVGHAYFIYAKDEPSLRRVWENQLKFFMQRAFRLHPAGYTQVEDKWNRIFIQPAEAVPVMEASPAPVEASGGSPVAATET